MKLLFYILFLTVVSSVLAQGHTNRDIENTINTGITERFLEGLTYWLDSVVKDVGVLITKLDSAINNLISNVLASVSNEIDNLVSLIDGLLAEARGSKKLVDDCAIRINEFELLKMRTSNLMGGCRSNLEREISGVLSDLGKERDRGNGLISSLTKSLVNCGKILFVACISNEQQSTLQEIQRIVNGVQSFNERIFLASDKINDCINDVEKNALRSANEIYRDIKNCVSNPSEN